MSFKLIFNDTFSLQGSKILVVDDSVTVRTRIVEFMRLEGFSTAEARNGAEVIPLARDFQPDLILLDVIMPDANGIDICRELRSFSAFQKTPIIMLTVKGSAYDVSEAFKAGANDYVRKPFGAEELMLRIRIHLNTMRLLQQLEEASGLIGNYMGAAAYEIRTPLMNILGLVQVLENEKSTLSEEELFILKSIGLEGQRLINLVNSMLEMRDLSFSTMTLSKEMVNLEYFLPETIRKASSLGRPRNIEFKLKTRIFRKEIYIDPDKIQHALDNLFFKILECIPPNSVILLRAINDDKELKMDIIGYPNTPIPHKDLENIDDTSNEELKTLDPSENFSLELGISRRIVEQHNGRMETWNTVPSGTRYYLRLPYDEN